VLVDVVRQDRVPVGGGHSISAHTPFQLNDTQQ
jgi:hypothetical protein